VPGEPQPSGNNDLELLRAVATGDEDALGQLYDRYARLVFTTARRMAIDRQVAEEVVQDVYVKVWRHAGRFDPRKGAFVNWLLSVTQRTALDRLRRRRLPLAASEETDRAGERLGAIEEAAPGPLDQALRSDDAATIQEAMKELTEAHRQTVVLAYFHGLARDEIAERMQVPVGTVKSRLKYALDRLRSVLLARGVTGV